MPTTILPRLLCPKMGLRASDKDPMIIAALVRSRRHQSAEQRAENVVAIAYEFNQDERNAIAAGAPVYFGQVVGGGMPFEQIVHVGNDVAAEYYNVPEATAEVLEEQRTKAREALVKSARRLVGLFEKEQTLDPANDIDRVGIKRDIAKALAKHGEALAALGTANSEAGY
jgi:hypothetical protein